MICRICSQTAEFISADAGVLPLLFWGLSLQLLFVISSDWFQGMFSVVFKLNSDWCEDGDVVECLRVLRSKFNDVTIERCRHHPAVNELDELNFKVLTESVGWLTVSAAHWRKTGLFCNVAMSWVKAHKAVLNNDLLCVQLKEKLVSDWVLNWVSQTLNHSYRVVILWMKMIRSSGIEEAKVRLTDSYSFNWKARFFVQSDSFDTFSKGDLSKSFARLTICKTSE